MQLSSIEPHRWRLGKQPTGPVRVNRTHKLTRGMYGFYIGSKTLGASMVDLWGVNNLSTVVGTVTPSVGKGGQGPKTATGSTSTPATTTSVNSDVADGRRYTVFMLVDITAWATWGVIFDRYFNSTPSQGFYIQRYSTNDSIYFAHQAAGSGVTTNFKLSNIVGKGLKALCFSYDGTSCRAYLDGVLQDTIAFTTEPRWYGGKHVLFGAGDPSQHVDGICHELALWTRALSDAEIFSISKDPYQFVEPVPPQMIGVTVGGGAAYSESLALGLQMATADNAGLAATGAMSLGMAAGVLEAGNMAAVSALALGLQAGLADNSTNALASSNLALGLGLVITSASFNQTSGALNLGLFVGAGVNGGQDFTVNIPLGLIAGLQINGGKSHNDSVDLGLVLGQAVAAAIVAYFAPTTRILGVQAENRTLEINIENRILVIAVENRTINIKLE